MHTKTELEGMSMDELQALAQKANAEMSEDRSTLIYNIIDAESLMTANNAVPKKRGRKPKAKQENVQEQPVAEEKTATRLLVRNSPILLKSLQEITAPDSSMIPIVLSTASRI